MDQQKSNLVFRLRSMYDYHEDSSALNDLFQRCEAADRMSASMSTGSTALSSGFHCEFTDYLWCMEQYSESYCGQLVDPLVENRILFICIDNLKRVHYGEHIMTAVFGRLTRVEPSRRRQHLILNLFSTVAKVTECIRLILVKSIC
jgi:hypothetical protein